MAEPTNSSGFMLCFDDVGWHTHTHSCMCTQVGTQFKPGTVPDYCKRYCKLYVSVCLVCIQTNVPFSRCSQTHTHAQVKQYIRQFHSVHLADIIKWVALYCSVVVGRWT